METVVGMVIKVDLGD